MTGEMKHLIPVNQEDIETGYGEVKEPGINDGATGFYLKIGDKEYILSEAATFKVCNSAVNFLEQVNER